jgi:hypothetical protein
MLYVVNPRALNRPMWWYSNCVSLSNVEILKGGDGETIKTRYCMWKIPVDPQSRGCVGVPMSFAQAFKTFVNTTMA